MWGQMRTNRRLSSFSSATDNGQMQGLREHSNARPHRHIAVNSMTAIEPDSVWTMFILKVKRHTFPFKFLQTFPDSQGISNGGFGLPRWSSTSNTYTYTTYSTWSMFFLVRTWKARLAKGISIPPFSMFMCSQSEWINLIQVPKYLLDNPD